jgi:hypothetical protein
MSKLLPLAGVVAVLLGISSFTKRSDILGGSDILVDSDALIVYNGLPIYMYGGQCPGSLSGVAGYHFGIFLRFRCRCIYDCVQVYLKQNRPSFCVLVGVLY